MKPKLQLFIACVILLLSWGCGQKSAKLQKSVVPPDKTLFETGSEYLKKSQYIKARLAFTTLMSTYPDSEMAADATLAIGDSYYDEGGTENLLMAEDSYKNFIVFFPAHPKAADAYMKIISLNYRMMHAPDRDQQPAFKTLEHINKFLAEYPDSDFAPIAKQIRLDVQESLAMSSYGIGLFYEEKQNFAGASQRYKEVLKEFPSYSKMDEVLLHLANVQEKSKNSEEAAQNYSRIISEYPFSKHTEMAKAQLKSLGKPIPSVDTKIAEENLARVKPEEGFSVLKPFIEFGKAIGFAPPPDLYKQAKKSIEDEKSKTQDAPMAAGAAEGGKAGDDIQIQTVIRKSASGETEDSTTVGPASSGSESANQDKKANTNKYGRKKNPKKSQ